MKNPRKALKESAEATRKMIAQYPFLRVHTSAYNRMKKETH